MSIIPKSETEITVEHVDLERGKEILDQDARERLGMSGGEFIRRYKAGQLDDFDSDVVFQVSILLPFAGESIG